MENNAYTGPAPASPEQVQAITTQLLALYPGAKYELDFTTSLELLVATQLAAQCTDARVNAVTRELFQKYRSADDYAQASQEELAQDIHAITFFNNKARNIRAACQYLLAEYGGQVPQTLAEIVKIPGVARKTANVILGNAFGVVEGFIVDTHVDRLSHRFGWTAQSDIVKIERDLMRLIPAQDWLPLAHSMILHGRNVCTARKPACARCVLVKVCPSAEV